MKVRQGRSFNPDEFAIALEQVVAGTAPGDEPYAQWFRPFDFWRGLGFDKESLIADPQFVDVKKDDYRLKDTSPAFKLGFEKIDLSTVGRGSGHDGQRQRPNQRARNRVRHN